VTTPRGTLLDLDPDAFVAGFDRTPFRIRHRLAEEPAFSLARLVELARALPEASVEYNAGDIPMSLEPDRTPHTGLSAEETIRRIEQCRSWMVLKNVEQHPVYRALLDRCLDEMQPLVDRVEPGMRDREAFVFISSPGAVTPFHIDPEQNFLLQIRGDKTMTVFDKRTPGLLTEPERESIFCGGHRNMVFRDEYARAGEACDMTPGIGVHVPFAAPHWVRVGPDPSISFSITFRTASTERQSAAYRLNAELRRRRFTPRPVGQSPLRDLAKSLTWRVIQRRTPRAHAQAS
jgi:hypothetical protein